MTNVRISKILDEHNIPHYEENGRIYADSMASDTEVFEEVDDLTGYTMNELKNWLGY